MGVMASQITSLTIVYSTVYSGANQRRHQISASLAFVRGIHRWPAKSPHKGPVTRKCFHLVTSSCVVSIFKETDHVLMGLNYSSLPILTCTVTGINLNIIVHKVFLICHCEMQFVNVAVSGSGTQLLGAYDSVMVSSCGNGVGHILLINSVKLHHFSGDIGWAISGCNSSRNAANISPGNTSRRFILYEYT